MLNFGVVLFEEEMVGEVVEDHWVGGVDLICARKLLNGGPDCVRSL